MRKNGQKCPPVGLKIKVRNKIQKSALAPHLFYEKTDPKIANTRENFKKWQKYNFCRLFKKAKCSKGASFSNKN